MTKQELITKVKVYMHGIRNIYDCCIVEQLKDCYGASMATAKTMLEFASQLDEPIVLTCTYFAIERRPDSPTKCSNCGRISSKPEGFIYCPECGAKITR